MRFKLDETSARWFEREFLRPAAIAQQEQPFVDKLREVWLANESVIDLSKYLDDAAFLAHFVGLLVKLGLSGNVYLEPFFDLAKRIDKTYNLSIVDRLGSLYNRPPPVPIKGVENTTRDRALQNLEERRRGPVPEVG